MRRSAAVFALGALVLLSGCNEGGGPSADASAAPSSSSPSAPPAQLALTPGNGSSDVSPVTPLEVAVTGGDVGQVTVADGSGAPVPGELADSPDTPGAEVWTPKEPLDYATSYTLTATATNASGDQAQATSTFTTVDPKTRTTPSVGPLDGQTVGVGLPIRVYFDQPVADKAAVQSHLKVTSSRPTDGVWSWLNDSEVHFRPSGYWPADTDVTLEADLYGVDMGNGVWGEKDRTVSFHVGDKHVSVADAGSHQLLVYDADQLVQTFPMSAGSNANPTRNGVHVVTESYADITMDSSTFGLAVDAPGGYRADVKYAVRMSNNGEFVHAAPWSVGSQGRANVSHGCINLSTERAQWFFGFSQPGDVVEVRNSVGPQLSRADGDIYDWTISWDDWKAGSALK